MLLPIAHVELYLNIHIFILRIYSCIQYCIVVCRDQASLRTFPLALGTGVAGSATVVVYWTGRGGALVADSLTFPVNAITREPLHIHMRAMQRKKQHIDLDQAKFAGRFPRDVDQQEEHEQEIDLELSELNTTKENAFRVFHETVLEENSNFNETEKTNLNNNVESTSKTSYTLDTLQTDGILNYSDFNETVISPTEKYINTTMELPISLFSSTVENKITLSQMTAQVYETTPTATAVIDVTEIGTSPNFITTTTQSLVTDELFTTNINSHTTDHAADILFSIESNTSDLTTPWPQIDATENVSTELISNFAFTTDRTDAIGVDQNKIDYQDNSSVFPTPTSSITTTIATTFIPTDGPDAFEVTFAAIEATNIEEITENVRFSNESAELEDAIDIASSNESLNDASTAPSTVVTQVHSEITVPSTLVTAHSSHSKFLDDRISGETIIEEAELNADYLNSVLIANHSVTSEQETLLNITEYSTSSEQPTNNETEYLLTTEYEVFTDDTLVVVASEEDLPSLELESEDDIVIRDHHRRDLRRYEYADDVKEDVIEVTVRGAPGSRVSLSGYAGDRFNMLGGSEMTHAQVGQQRDDTSAGWSAAR